LRESRCEGLYGERFAFDRRRLDQREVDERAVETRCIRGDDPVGVDLESDRSPRLAAGRVTEDFPPHRARLATLIADVLHPADEAAAVANLASQVGAVRNVGIA
jgi:hypothetical protein